MLVAILLVIEATTLDRSVGLKPGLYVGERRCLAARYKVYVGASLKLTADPLTSLVTVAKNASLP